MTEYLTVKDVSDILHFSRTKTYALVNTKDFPKIIFGHDIRIPKEEFENYLKHNLYKSLDI